MKQHRQIPFAVFLCVLVAFGRSTQGAGENGAAPPSGEVASGMSAPQPRPWPVDVPVHLSSSFGEFRDGHLHAGVDIRSFGREGIPCRALESGYVARLRASPFGYGKAVYLKLDSGETAVYAHLSEFAPTVDSVVCAAQARKGRYETDITLAPGELPVMSGEVIGYTGRTGTAAPHLHFEVRDSEENPVNPLDIGWVLADEVPPTIRRVEFLPLTPDSRINGRCAPLVMELRAVDARTFAAPETVAVNGIVGVAVQVSDRTDAASGRLAPFRVELEVDGTRVASIQMKRFTYANMQEVELAYDMATERAKGQHFLFLFRRTGETLWNREFTNDGLIQTDNLGAGQAKRDGVHTAAVRAVDRAGNSSVASLPFVLSHSPEVGSSGAARNAVRPRRSEGRGELAGCYFFDGVASVDRAALASEDSVRAARAGGAAPGTVASEAEDLILSPLSVGDTGLTLAIQEKGRTRHLHLFSLRTDSPLNRGFDDIGFNVAADKGSVYADAFVYVARWEGSVKAAIPAGSGLHPATGGVRLGPMGAVFRRPIEIRFSPADSLQTRRAIFFYDVRNGKWTMRQSAGGREGVSARVREPGIYAVLIDSLPPAIGVLQVKSRKSYATGARVREAVIPISDRGSGLDADRTEVYLDGKKQIARWDGFPEKMFVILDGPNIIGWHDLSVVAVDRLGNTSRLVHRFQISAPVEKGGSGGRR